MLLIALPAYTALLGRPGGRAVQPAALSPLAASRGSAAARGEQLALCCSQKHSLVSRTRWSCHRSWSLARALRQVGSPPPDEPPRPPSPHLALGGPPLPARPGVQQLQSLASSSHTTSRSDPRLAALLAPSAPPRLVRRPPPCRASPRGAARLLSPTRASTQGCPPTSMSTVRVLSALQSNSRRQADSILGTQGSTATARKAASASLAGPSS